MLLVGIGQRTWWLPSATMTVEAELSTLKQGKDAPLLVIKPEALPQRGGPVTITAQNDNAQNNNRLFLAQGRSDDVAAWVGKTAHLSITGVNSSFTDLETSYADEGGPKADPAGSDLWVEQQTAQGELTYQWRAPDNGRWALLLASDGSAPAVHKVSLTVPNDNSTPWAVPLMVIGGIMIVIGLLLWIFLGGLLGRRARPGRRAARAGLASLFLLFTATLMLTSLIAPVQAQAQENGSPHGSVAVTGNDSSVTSEAQPVLTEEQFTRVLNSVAATVAEADAAKDQKLLEPRVGGQALQDRSANYTIRATAPDYQAREAVAANELLSRIVSTDRAWPRTVIAVTKSDQNVVPQVLVLTQATARENYKLSSTARILPGMTLPPPERSGEAEVPSDSKDGVATSPDAALSAFAQALTDPQSEARGKFADSAFLNDTRDLQAKLVNDSKDANFTFKHTVVPGSLVAFRASDGGLIVTGNLTFTVEATPKSENATLTLTDDGSKALAGGESTQKGFTLEFTEHAVLIIPAGSDPGPTTVVAAERALVGATFK